MEINTILVTGESLFLNRHQFLFNALSTHFELDFCPRQSEWFEAKLPRTILKGLLSLRTGSLIRANSVFQKNETAFALKSQRAEREIQLLCKQPDLIFQVFGTYCPVWTNDSIPYVMFLDYTTALAEKNWIDWATFLSDRARNAWFEREQLAYNRAKHIFSMSQVVKESLIRDYEVPKQKVTVVGSSGDFQEPYSGEKRIGSNQILFNGSDFERKGGELVLAAFRKVRQAIPNAKLVIIGKKLNIIESGVENPGHIASRSEIRRLFLTTDLVVAPAYCDPFPTFLMEAMNYGIPCIVTSRDGMPEIVDHGINGVVLQALSAEELAQNLIELLINSSRLELMSEAARNKIRNRLNWTAIAATISQTLKSGVAQYA